MTSQYDTYVTDNVPHSYSHKELNDMRRLIAETSGEGFDSTQDMHLRAFIEWLFDPETFGVEEEETP